MFDIGWTELLLIGVVALIVIGPQDLPDMFRQLGRFTAKLRTMSRDFQRAMEQAAKESGVRDIAKDVNTIASPKGLGLNAVKEAADRFEKWDPLKPAAAATKQPLTPPPMPPSPSSAAAQATAAANPSLAPVGGLGMGPTPEELADAEPELPRDLGPETRALYQKKAKADAARAASRAAKAAPVAPPVATPMAAAPATTPPRKRAAQPAAKSAAKSAAQPAAQSAAPSAAPEPAASTPAPPVVADAKPKAPRRKKADPA